MNQYAVGCRVMLYFSDQKRSHLHQFNGAQGTIVQWVDDSTRMVKWDNAFPYSSTGEKISDLLPWDHSKIMDY